MTQEWEYDPGETRAYEQRVDDLTDAIVTEFITVMLKDRTEFEGAVEDQAPRMADNDSYESDAAIYREAVDSARFYILWKLGVQP